MYIIFIENRKRSKYRQTLLNINITKLITVRGTLSAYIAQFFVKIEQIENKTNCLELLNSYGIKFIEANKYNRTT